MTSSTSETYSNGSKTSKYAKNDYTCTQFGRKFPPLCKTKFPHNFSTNYGKYPANSTKFGVLLDLAPSIKDTASL